MNPLKLILLGLVALCTLFTSCEEENLQFQIEPRPPSPFQLEYSTITPQGTYSKILECPHLVSVTMRWEEKDDGILLEKTTYYQDVLDNNQKVQFRIGYVKKESNKDLLELKEATIEGRSSGSEWAYKDKQDEVNRFYKDYERVIIQIEDESKVYTINDNMFTVESVQVASNDEIRLWLTMDVEAGTRDGRGYYQLVGRFIQSNL